MSWLEKVADVPADGLWHPVEIEPGKWQAVLHEDEGLKQCYTYDTDLLPAYAGAFGPIREHAERISVIHETKTACLLRCTQLNFDRPLAMVDL